MSEGELLARIFPRLAVLGSPLLGPGDDAAVLAAPDGRVVVSTDTQTEGQDFRIFWPNGYHSSGADVGWKAAAQNLSDINAMGAVATGMVVSLTLPAETEAEWVDGLADGLVEAIRSLGAAGCTVAGGDLGMGGELSVTVTVLGNLEGRAPLLRSGARPGDVLAVAGRLGWAAAGLALLEHGPAYEGLQAALRDVIRAHCRPEPPLSAGPEAARAGANALMDLSDGLLKDGDRLGRASGVVLDLDAAVLRGYAELLAGPASLMGADPLLWVLGGGEDHGLLAAFEPSAQLPRGFTAIGSVVPAAGGPGGVAVAGRPAQPSGWDHFAR
ncbi:thiamine-phosphate kinase [Sinomonas notoginsengisoli]|uniref:thiamine-phosphate kinase n=1 Tax=Sinomonas notoginsengisoli TaxID=1457311 RepID=UPI001F335AC0|nr:thiamine-phosphate kinase [Sinomonas notoginsengisoli]